MFFDIKKVSHRQKKEVTDMSIDKEPISYWHR